MSVAIPYSDPGTERQPTIVLLHGMGATAAVWRGVVRELRGRWSGGVVALDLPGHGASAPLEGYSFETVTAAVADALARVAPIVAVGHSFGGVIAVMLASGEFGVETTAAVASSVKVTWSPDELARAADVAARPARVFSTRAEAEQRYRLVSGLTDEVTTDPADLERGVVEADGGFRLGYDARAVTVGDPQMAGALSRARCPVLLARGAADPMVTADELRALSSAVQEIPAAGHNVHVERPDAFADAVVAFAATSLSGHDADLFD